jgi:two-component system nitrogen regulation response regulator NtrX
MAHDVLIVDDEADIRMLVNGILHDEGYQVREASDSISTFEQVASRRPNLVLLDIWLEGSDRDGLEILELLQQQHPAMPVIIMTGHGSVETAVSAIKSGAYDFIEKPFKRAIEAAQLRLENAELRLRAGTDTEIIGNSPAIQSLRQAIDKVAPTGSRVLVSGPAGVGKELVARRVHLQSGRANGPFVVLNCASMHPDRMEEELFGIEEPMNEGGPPRKTGTFEQAHGGTLYLDEVADMPLATQGKIVRVLQEQTFQRVGGATSVQVDVRVIASTNRGLSAMIAEGTFREDLLYRLNVVPLTVPPLKDRREDIPALANIFLERSAQVAGLPEQTLAPDTLAALQAHDWPGNVRQLRNVMEWLLIMGRGQPGEPIRAESLPAELIQSASTASIGWDKGSEILGLALRDAREVFEREYLLAQVTRFDGNISRTATFVGMERSALHRKLKGLGVDPGMRARGTAD